MVLSHVGEHNTTSPHQNSRQPPRTPHTGPGRRPGGVAATIPVGVEGDGGEEKEEQQVRKTQLNTNWYREHLTLGH